MNPKEQTKLKTMPAWYERFRITNGLIEESGVRRVTDNEARRVCKLDAPPDRKLDGIAFPYIDRNGKLTDYVRLRLDEPYTDEKNKTHKYHGVSKKRTQRILYAPGGTAKRLKSKKTLIVLVEAEKSALAIEAWARRTGRTEILPLGMGGCQGWQQKDAKGHPGTLPDMDVVDGRPVIVLLDANVKTNPDVRNARNNLVAELSSRKCQVLVAELPLEKGVNGPDDYLAQHTDEEFAEVLAAAATCEVAPYSEQALALRFAAEYANSVLYVPGAGYYVWDGKCWRRDDKGEVDKLAHVLCKTAAGECGKATLADRVRSNRTREAILRNAQPYMALGPESLDKEPALLGTPAGTVDLRTGKLRNAQRDDYITMLTAVAPDWKTTPKRFLKFLDEIAGGDRALIAYLQRVFGYGLTGEINEHALFYLDGKGRNGKSTLLETVKKILRDYAGTAPMAMFLAQPFEEHSTGTAALRGKRAVFASETRTGQFWDEEKLKRYSGGDTLTARFMRRDYISFVPNMTIVLSGNHRPRFRNVDDAIRDRFFVIPFRQHFAREDDRGKLKKGSKLRDPKLDKSLEAEWPAILAWMIDGAREWYKSGLRTPRVVKEVSAEYMAEQNNVKMWADEAVVVRVNKKEPVLRASAAHTAYVSWCITHKEYATGKTEFVKRMEELGHRKTDAQNLTTFPDVRLRGVRVGYSPEMAG